METPAISVLIPVKNAEHWIAECLDSIQKQTFSAWEAIIIDDHSTDSTQKIVQRYLEKDERMHAYSNKGDGIIPALQQALDLSNGTFITRMDADDIMPLGKLKTLFSLAKQKPFGLATGYVKYFSPHQNVSEGYLNYEQWLNSRCVKNDHWQWVYRECVVASPNWMAHRSLIDFKGLNYPEDYDLVFQWYEQRLVIRSSIEITHLWREHPDRTSRNSIHYQQSAFFNLKLKHFLEQDHDFSRQLCLLGNNKKSKLTGSVLDNYHISYVQIDQTNLMELWQLNHPQLLICVYPEEEQRQSMNQKLESHGLNMGMNYWYL